MIAKIDHNIALHDVENRQYDFYGLCSASQVAEL
jgi:hypothetical protein